MNEENETKIMNFILGFWTGIMLVAIISAIVPDSIYNKVHDAITKCEQNLPRTQVCVITAVPELKQH